MKITMIFASLVCFSQRVKCEDFQLVESSTSGKEDFTFKILKAEQGNQVFSPINIAHAFGFLLLGADGETENEISNILGYESTEECLNSIESSLSACNTDSIECAANLFLNQKFDLLKEYVASTKKLGAQVSKVDYSNSVAAAGIINNWVSKQTDGLIDEIISPEMLDPVNTKLTLATAILFKGKWKEEFETVRDQDFKATTGLKRTKFMKITSESLGYHKDEDNTQVVDIPYQDRISGWQFLKMTVIMPEGNLEDFESTLTTHKMNHYFQNACSDGVDITLKMPKFKFEATYDLKKTLSGLGHGIIFDENIKHDYSRMISKKVSEDLFISDAIHKATIEVEEKGTIAAAATAMVAKDCFDCEPEPLKITIDKPFLFFIRSGNHVIFAGRVVDPTI